MEQLLKENEMKNNENISKTEKHIPVRQKSIKMKRFNGFPSSSLLNRKSSGLVDKNGQQNGNGKRVDKKSNASNIGEDYKEINTFDQMGMIEVDECN